MPSSVFDSSLYRDAFGTPAMRAVFCDEAFIAAVVKVEVALARVVDAYAKRLQIQEKMTSQIANTIDKILKPEGVAVVIKATHHCMSTRGVHKNGTDLVTSRMLGAFRNNAMTRQEFMSMVD